MADTTDQFVSRWKQSLAKKDFAPVQEYLIKDIPSLSSIDICLATTSDETSQNILRQYRHLIKPEYPLGAFSNIRGYPQKKITNLMVIAARGYSPILEYRINELTKDLIYQEDINGRNALDYAKMSSNPKVYSILDSIVKNSELSDLPSEAVEQILLNVDPEELNQTCRSSFVFSNICSDEIFQKKYVRHNFDKLVARLLSLPPVEANKLAKVGLYQSIIEDPNFQEIYFDHWKSEFADDGCVSNLSRDRLLAWTVNEKPFILDSNGGIVGINISILRDDPSTGEILDDPISSDIWERLMFPRKPIKLVYADNYDVQPDTLFGTTLRSYFEQLYKFLYTSVTSVRDDGDDDYEPESEHNNLTQGILRSRSKIPDSYEIEADHLVYEGYTIQNGYYYISIS